MEDQTTWKGHTFTLLVFTGMVVLCSIFFILGMLVGRAQGQKIASANNTPAAEAEKLAAALEPSEEKPNFTFYDSVKKEQPAVLERPAPKADPPALREPAPKANAKPEAKPEPPPRVTSKPENVVNYQIGAIRKSSDAEKLLDELKKKGFRGFILAPSKNDPNPYFRVQVGPFSDPVEAEDVKKRLGSAGYQPILKK
jgi:cell division septation protein DedD